MNATLGTRNSENDMGNIRREVGMRGSLATAWIMGVMLVVALVGASAARADGVPQFLNVQGVLYDNDGNPVNDTYDLTVSLYRASAGGPANLVFQQAFADSVVENGIFHATLSIPTTGGNPFVLYPELWLGIAIDADDEMTPRQRLTSVGYAMEAKHADEASKARDVFCDGDGDPLTDDPVPCVGRGELVQTYALGDTDQEALSAVSLSTKCVGCVDSVRIKDDTIATVDLGNGVVTSAKIANGTILSEDIADQQVLSVDIANESIQTDDIKDGEVRTSDILNGTIITEDLAALAVSNAKLGADAVTTDKIQNGQVMTVDLADNAVINEKLADGAVTNRNIGEIINQSNLPIAGKTADTRGTVIVGDYLAVDPTGVVAVDLNALNFDIDAGLPVGQNLVQWEDVKWKNKADKSANWHIDTCTSGPGSCTVITTQDEPRHGGYAIRFAGNGAWVYARDMIEVAPDREYFGRIRARNASSSSPTSFLSGVRCFDKMGVSLGDQWFMVSEDANPQLHSLGKTFSGIVNGNALPLNTRYVQPIVGMTGSNGQIDVDALEIFELTTANDVVCAGCVQSADIADGTLVTDDLADGAVTSAKIADGTIVSADLGAGEVKTVNLADGAVQTAKLADSAVSSAKIGDGQVASIDILDGGVTTNDLALGAVTSVKIGDGEVKTADLANGEATSEKIQNATIGTVDLANDSVTAAILAPDAVDTAALQNQAVTSGKIANDAVGAQHIATGQVTTDEILNGTIGADDLSSALSWIAGGDVTIPNNKNLIFADDASSNDGAWLTEATTGIDDIEVRMVLGFEEDSTERFSIYRYSDAAGTVKTKEHEFDAAGNAYHKGNLTIGGGNIDAGAGNITTTGTISGVLQCPAGECISSAEIENGTISNEDIANAAGIAPAKIQGGALTNATLFTGGQVTGYWNTLAVNANTITTAQIKNDQITNGLMADNAITTTEILDGTILGADIASDTITNAKIATGAVGSDEIIDASIQTADLATDSVDAAQIKAGAVGASEILDNSITSADIGANQILTSHISPTAYGASGVSTLIARSDHQHDTSYVNTTGDTMTGDLVVEHNGDTKVTVRSTNGNKAILALESTGLDTDASLRLTALNTVNLTGANLVLDAGMSVSAQNLTLAGSVACTGCVDTTDIADGTITSSDLTNAGIAKSKIVGTALAQNDSFAGGDMAAGSVYNNLQLGAGVVGAAELATNSVYTAAIQDSAVTTGKIADGTILGTDLATDTITATQIATGAIGSLELAANSVYTNAIQSLAVTASKLANGSVSGGQDSAGTNAIVDNSVTTYDIQDGTIQAADLTSNFWSNLSTNFVVKDGKQLLFEDIDDADRQAYFQEFSGAGALDLGLVLGNNNSDLADQTFTIYSTDGATKVQRHQFKADGTAQLNSDVTVGNPSVDLTAGEQARVATYRTTRGDLVVTGAIIHPKDAAAGNGTALSVADVFEIRSDAYSSSVAHGFLGADATNLVLSAGDKGAGVLTLNRKDNTTAGNVVTGGNLQVGGSLLCSSAAGDCVSGSSIANGTITTDDVLNNTLTANDIAANAIGASELADNAVDTNAIAANAVITGKILDGTILAADVATDTLGAGQIAANAIGSSELADGAVDTNAIVDANVTSVKLADSSVTSAKILDNSITTGDILDYTILAQDIANGTLTLDKFTPADRPFAPGKTISLYKLSNEAGESLFFEDDADANHQDATDAYMREVSDDAVTDLDVRLVLPDGTGAEAFTVGVNNTINTYKHKFDTLGDAYHTRNLSVGGAATVTGLLNANGNYLEMKGKTAVSAAATAGTALYIGGDASTVDYTSINLKAATTVTGAVTASNFVCTDCLTSGVIAANAVGTSEVTDNSLGAIDIATDAIGSDELAPNAVTSTELADGAVTLAKHADNSVNSTKIVDGTITNSDINATANIAATKIAGNALTGATAIAGHLTGSFAAAPAPAGTLTLTLKNDVVGASQIVDGSVASADIADNSITTNDILNGTITAADLAFPVPTAGGNITIDRGSQLIFGTGGDNDGAYFQETSPGAVDNQVELSLNLTDDGDTTERFAIKSNSNERHVFYGNGNAKHTGSLTVLGNSTVADSYAAIFRDSANPSNYYLDPASVSYLNDIRPSILYDRDNTGYYIDPNGTSVTNTFYASIMYDTNNSGYYVDPASVSIMNDVRASIYYDRDNTGYYMDPSGGSNVNTMTAGDYYTNGWFRNNNASQGLYNTATGRHFYSESSAYWTVASGNGLIFRNSHAGTVTGRVYWNGTAGSNNFGLLSPDGNWKVRVDNSSVELYNTTYTNVQYGYIWYDRNDGNYYMDPNGTSMTNDFRANIYYDRNNTGYYMNPEGDNNFYRVYGQADIRSPIFYDLNDTGYYLDPNGWSRQAYIHANIVAFDANYDWRGSGRDGALFRWGGVATVSVDDWFYINDSNKVAGPRVSFNVDHGSGDNSGAIYAGCVSRGGTARNDGCLSGWTAAGDFCYSAYRDAGTEGYGAHTWPAAVSGCARLNAHLCSIAEYTSMRQVADVNFNAAWASDACGDTCRMYFNRNSPDGDIDGQTTLYASLGWYCCMHK